MKADKKADAKADVKDDAKVDAVTCINLRYSAMLCANMRQRCREAEKETLGKTQPRQYSTFLAGSMESDCVTVGSPSDNKNGIYRKLPSRALSRTTLRTTTVLTVLVSVGSLAWNHYGHEWSFHYGNESFWLFEFVSDKGTAS